MNLVRKELEKYIPIVNLIAEMFGKSCEVVLHDLSKPEHSVVYIVNSHVSGRKLGESFDYLINRVLISNRFEKDLLANYYFTGRNGNKIKSSTAFLRDDKNKVTGALCVNFTVDEIESFSNSLINFLGEKEYIKEEANEVETETKDVSSIDDILDDMLDSSIPISALNMSRDEKLETLQFLDEKGVFLVKGAIDKVAIHLGVSKVTVYSYLDEIRSQSKD